MINLQKYFKIGYELRVKFKETIFELLSYFYIKIYLIVIITLNLFNWLLVFYILSKVNQPQIVLHYNVDFGVNLYGNANKILTVPLVGLVVLAVNLGVVGLIPKKEKFAIHLLLASAVMVNLLILVSEAALFLINLR